MHAGLQEPHAAAAGAAARLCFERVGLRTRVTSAFAASPLRILTPQNQGHAGWAYTSSLGGGLVDGDRVCLEVSVGPGAAGVLSTQGNARVYRCSRGCSSQLLAEVGERGLLALLPDPTVCFAGARYHQRTEVRLERGAAVVVVDVLSAGRTARGERWAFRRYSSELVLRAGGTAVVDEATLLDPAHGPIAERFGRFDALATVVVAGEPLREAMAALGSAIAALPAAPHQHLVQSANAIGGALLLRIAAASVEELLRAIRAHLRFLPSLLGDDPWARRH
jgi:urease accessory protein